MNRASTITSPADRAALSSLRRRWSAVAALFALVLAALALLLNRQWPTSTVVAWLGLAGLTLVYELRLLSAHLGDHRRYATGPLLSGFGYGMLLTLYRGLAIGLLAGFLLTPWPGGLLAWLPAVLYTLVGLADYFDGYLARIFNHATPLGARLDLEFDALGVLVVATLAVHLGQWPIWFLVIGLARYVFVFGLWWRRRRGLANRDLSPSNTRRIVAGMEMGMLSAILWPIMPAVMATLVGVLFAVPFLAVFIRDWLAVTGALDTRSPRYQVVRRRLLVLVLRWLPLPARLLATAAVTAVLMQSLLGFDTFATALADFGLPWGIMWAALFALVELLALPFLLLGVFGRLAALLAVIPIGFTIFAAGFSPERAMALVSCLFVFIFGTGMASLWQPEVRWFARRPGEGASDAGGAGDAGGSD